jgi:hypothetical protein
MESADIDIVDIAHALGNQCRFAGHTNKFYSVAEHSVLVSSLVPPKFALQGLLHDAHEAYMTDVPTPMKQCLPDYAALELKVEARLRWALGVPAEFDPCVKDADREALWIEREQLLPPNPAWERPEWERPPPRMLPVYLNCFPPHIAKAVFLQRYYDLTMAAKGAPNSKDGVRFPGRLPDTEAA